jgi:MOSC domain-containing protein YiiM
MTDELTGTVIAVSCDSAHGFSKRPRQSVRLIKDHGIEGDAHAGRFMKHRYLANRAPKLPNSRQVHLIQSELFGNLRLLGFEVAPGQLGENVTTKGLNLLNLPLGSLLHLGSSAVVELTGLRTPCGMIDRFQKGLKRAMIVRTPAGVTFRAGVLSVVRESGDLSNGDCIRVSLPSPPWQSLPAL